MKNQVKRGQYGAGIVDGKKVEGYRQERNVDPQSTVETFVGATLFIDNKRWKQVPITITAGKRLNRSLVQIEIQFKNAQMGTLIFRVQPKPAIFILQQTGAIREIGDQKALAQAMDAYPYLIERFLEGDTHSFIGLEELLASWKLWSPVLKYWKKHPPRDFPNYAAGSCGPLCVIQTEFAKEKEKQSAQSPLPKVIF